MQILSNLKQLQNNKDFCDVTIKCEDQNIDTHKMILAGGSLLFKNLLKENPTQHPFIYLRGVKFSQLSKILDFLYKGEVKLDRNELDDFLSVAQDLQINGLDEDVLEDSKLSKYFVEEGGRRKRRRLVGESTPIEKDCNLDNEGSGFIQHVQWQVVNDIDSNPMQALKLKLKKSAEVRSEKAIIPEVRNMTMSLYNSKLDLGTDLAGETERPGRSITPSPLPNTEKNLNTSQKKETLCEDDVEIKKMKKISYYKFSDLSPKVWLEKIKMPLNDKGEETLISQVNEEKIAKPLTNLKLCPSSTPKPLPYSKISNDQCEDTDGKKDIVQEIVDVEKEEKKLRKESNISVKNLNKDQKIETICTDYKNEDVEMKKLYLTPRVMLKKIVIPEAQEKNLTKPSKEEHLEEISKTSLKSKNEFHDGLYNVILKKSKKMKKVPMTPTELLKKDLPDQSLEPSLELGAKPKELKDNKPFDQLLAISKHEILENNKNNKNTENDHLNKVDKKANTKNLILANSVKKEALFTNKQIPNEQVTFPSNNQKVTGRLRIRDIASLSKIETDDSNSSSSSSS